VHPIERLRAVARAEGAPASLLVTEAAAALAAFAEEPAAVVTACRRLVDRHGDLGPMWWLAARVLASADPAAEAYAAAEALRKDRTPAVLEASLPEEACVVVVGWPDLASGALGRRCDLSVLVVEDVRDGAALARRLRSSGVESCEVAASGLGAAVGEAGLVLLEALALGPGGFLAPSGSLAAAAVARAVSVPVWTVAGAGRVLPGRLFEALVQRLEDQASPPWERGVEVVPTALADAVVGPAGLGDPAEAWRRADCPLAPELLRRARA
jgi:hypothetical protein